MEKNILTEEDSQEPPGRSSLKVKTKRNKLTLEPPIITGSFFVSNERHSVEIVTDLERCFKLWKKFNPQKTLFDTWEFRLAFYNAYKYDPYFILLKKGRKIVGMLPLWYETKNFYEKNKIRYTWFGSDWQEEVRFFAKEMSYIPLLLSLAPSPLHLNAISEPEVAEIKEPMGFKEDLAKYVLNLEGFNSLEDYLMNLKKKERRSLRKDKARIEKLNPKIIINRFSDLDSLIKLCRKRFKKDSDWLDPRRVKAFQEFIKLGGTSYQVRMITVEIGKRIAGVDLIAIFNNCYFVPKCGYDVERFPGIGNYLNMLDIEDAIKLGMKKVDLLQNNYHWKEKFFTSVPLLLYEK